MSNKDRQPAEMFPVGEFIRDEMVERGWTVEDLSKHAVLPVDEVLKILDGSGPMLARHAERIGIAFGTGAHVWMNLNRGFKKWSKSK